MRRGGRSREASGSPTGYRLQTTGYRLQLPASETHLIWPGNMFYGPTKAIGLSSRWFCRRGKGGKLGFGVAKGSTLTAFTVGGLVVKSQRSWHTLKAMIIIY